jgi:hypothetical protein
MKIQLRIVAKANSEISLKITSDVIEEEKWKYFGDCKRALFIL